MVPSEQVENKIPVRESVERRRVEREDRARVELDGLVINMELTLISVIQGIALYFLSDSSRTPVLTMQLTLWPYIAVGLLTILLFWSRSAIHTLTVIRWPLEFGHNFFYIGCTLVEAIMFTQVSNVPNWFVLGAVYAALIWALFAFDLRMVDRQLAITSGANGQKLFTTLAKEQRFNVRFLMPSAVVFHAAAAIAIRTWPQFFLEQNGHLALAAFQLIAAVVYLILVLRLFSRVSPLILGHRREIGE